jgi:triosephosphate isomerase
MSESDKTVQLKTGAAVGAGLVPILCVGETEQECELGETERRRHDQLQSAVALVDTGRLGEVVIAYKPL